MKRIKSILAFCVALTALSFVFAGCQKPNSAPMAASTSTAGASSVASDAMQLSPEEMSKQLLSNMDIEPLSSADYEKALANAEAYVKEQFPGKKMTFQYYEKDLQHPQIADDDWAFFFSDQIEPEMAMYFTVVVAKDTLEATSNNHDEILRVIEESKMSASEAAASENSAASVPASTESTPASDAKAPASTAESAKVPDVVAESNAKAAFSKAA